MPKKYVKSWFAKQTFQKVYRQPPKKKIDHHHYKVTKPNGHHQFDLLYVPHNVFEVKTHKYILTGVDVAKTYKVSRALRIKKPTEITLALEAIYQK